MKKMSFSGAVLTIFFIGMSFSVGNEFIKDQKEKKFYPSCQQCLELHGDVIDVINRALNGFNDFAKLLIDTQRAAISEINLYLEGEKACFLQSATKKQRACFYQKHVTIKRK